MPLPPRRPGGHGHEPSEASELSFLLWTKANNGDNFKVDSDENKLQLLFKKKKKSEQGQKINYIPFQEKEGIMKRVQLK